MWFGKNARYKICAFGLTSAIAPDLRFKPLIVIQAICTFWLGEQLTNPEKDNWRLHSKTLSRIWAHTCTTDFKSCGTPMSPSAAALAAPQQDTSPVSDREHECADLPNNSTNCREGRPYKRRQEEEFCSIPPQILLLRCASYLWCCREGNTNHGSTLRGTLQVVLLPIPSNVQT